MSESERYQSYLEEHEKCLERTAAVVAEAEATAIVWAVEWVLKQVSKQEEWSMSWQAGFPGIKVQALLDYAARERQT